MTRLLRLGSASLLASLVVLLFFLTSARAEPIPPAGPDGITVTRPRREPEDIDARFDIGAHALYSLGDLDGRLLDGTPAFRSSDMRLQGRGTFVGGALSGTFVVSSFRFGVTLAAFSVPNVTLTHAPLSPDLSLSLQRPYGFTVDASPGWEWHFGRFVPYAEMRLGVADVVPSVDVRSARLGPVQTLSRPIITAVVAPKIGLQYRLSEWVALDVSGSISPVGAEMMRLQAGVVFKMTQGK
jgi:hypothetical protein